MKNPIKTPSALRRSSVSEPFFADARGSDTRPRPRAVSSSPGQILPELEISFTSLFPWVRWIFQQIWLFNFGSAVEISFTMFACTSNSV